MKASEFIVIFSTCPSEQVAMDLALQLVEKKLAAGVNILPIVKSIYIWKGETRIDDEVQLMIKTQRDKFEAISAHINEVHPYELPEVVAVSLTCGLSSYLSWINKTVE